MHVEKLRIIVIFLITDVFILDKTSACSIMKRFQLSHDYKRMKMNV